LRVQVREISDVSKGLMSFIIFSDLIVIHRVSPKAELENVYALENATILKVRATDEDWPGGQFQILLKQPFNCSNLDTPQIVSKIADYTESVDNKHRRSYVDLYGPAVFTEKMFGLCDTYEASKVKAALIYAQEELILRQYKCNTVVS
jgi:hypothetical protein